MASVELEMTMLEIVIEAVEYWLDHQDGVENQMAAEKAERVLGPIEWGVHAV